MNVTIIDYGAGNIQSVIFALQRLGINALVASDANEISRADKVIFPGVGHATAAMDQLRIKGLDQLIPKLTQPVLGICLGMQLMCNSTEEGGVKGLGIFDTAVKLLPQKLNVPHMGWNQIKVMNTPIFSGVESGSNVYFVHSFYAENCEDTIAETNYNLIFSAGLHKNNFYGCQFHPEKSGEIGDQILKNFLAL
jgi:imidazole glycerol-phosphate synthase subunit HisH